MQQLPPALLPLGAWSQFVTWVAAPHPHKPGKLNKFPTDWASGGVIDAHNPAYWTSAACAMAVAGAQDRGHGAGTGFVFTDQDPFFFLDIDGAWDPVAQQWSPIALELCARLAGAAVEVSLSGTGLHIIGRTVKGFEHAKKNTPLGLELYTSKRFAALTGVNAQGDVMTDCTAALAAVVAQYFPPTATGDWAGWTVEPVPEYTGPPDDDELLRRAMASGGRNPAAAFGGGLDVTFSDLWNANADALGRKWPHDFKPFDASNADMALANMLAFWTGKNCERMERLMVRSALNRDKWHVRPTYLADTIVKACAFVQTVYTAAPPAPPVAAPPPPEQLLATAQATGRKLRDATREFMGPMEQLEYFRGCYYDNQTEKVYSLPHNTVFSKSAFDVNYGGHMFILDPSSQKTTDSAWEAYTKSRVNIPEIVDGLCFRPEEAPGALIHDGKRVYVNSYVPHHPRVEPGDPSKFLTHVAKLLPDETDRKILLSYLAAMAQNPGHKFQWWPVIQGVEGNGKTILISVMTHVVGQEYTHLPNSHKMAKNGSNFNSWIYRKLFIGVEEIMLSHKRDFLDEFKVVVTNDRLEIEGKGKDQFTGDNRVNGILCTNHKDGVPITVDSRRYSIFFTAQQCAEDLARDGMNADYFADLWDWVKGRGAYAAQGENYGAACVANYLLTMEIEEAFNPARLSTRAPKTSSTDEALMASLGRAEQEIMDAVDEGRTGFAGGWVSSVYLDALLDQIKAAVPRNKRRQMMRQLGYDYHPALRDGRTNDMVTPDGRKPRLYVKDGHLALNMDQPAEIARAYSKAQEPAAAVQIAAPAVVAFGPKPS